MQKYAVKYTYTLADKEKISLSYLDIEDNIMKETDDGHIYGIGYQNGAFALAQYLSDYRHFDVYQTDVKYSFFQRFENATKAKLTLIAKYMRLSNEDSNPFSKNAKKSYLSPGVKIHIHRDDYHFGVGAFFGKRIFSVMKDGLTTQHHAMEFSQTYMAGIGKRFGAFDMHLKYIHQKAEEIPIHNKNVIVDNVALMVKYVF